MQVKSNRALVENVIVYVIWVAILLLAIGIEWSGMKDPLNVQWKNFAEQNKLAIVTRVQIQNSADEDTHTGQLVEVEGVPSGKKLNLSRYTQNLISVDSSVQVGDILSMSWKDNRIFLTHLNCNKNQN